MNIAETLAEQKRNPPRFKSIDEIAAELGLGASSRKEKPSLSDRYSFTCMQCGHKWSRTLLKRWHCPQRFCGSPFWSLTDTPDDRETHRKAIEEDWPVERWLLYAARGTELMEKLVNPKTAEPEPYILPEDQPFKLRTSAEIRAAKQKALSEKRKRILIIAKADKLRRKETIAAVKRLEPIADSLEAWLKTDPDPRSYTAAEIYPILGSSFRNILALSRYLSSISILLERYYECTVEQQEDTRHGRPIKTYTF